jgi:hypothetical protein
MDHCFYVDRYVPSTPAVSVGFQKRYVTPCHECCSIQNKQIVVYYFCEACIILPIITLIISSYANQYFTCLLLKYCTWNDFFIFGDWCKLVYLLPVLDSLGFDCKSHVELRSAKSRNRELSEITYLNDICKWLQLVSISTNYQTVLWCICLVYVWEKRKNGKLLDINLLCTKESHVLVCFFNSECV